MVAIFSNFRLLRFCLLNVGESQALVPSAGIILTCTPASKHQWFLHEQPCASYWKRSCLSPLSWAGLEDSLTFSSLSLGENGDGISLAG